MSKYAYDNISIIRDGARWFPTMGEIHYSRVPRQYWAETLNKMKAGGVDIVSAYVIWIHHEEIEGEYDWTGDRDLRGFLQTAGQCGVKVLLRIGPWCHGEVRNGGFPDWLLKKGFEPRTNDEAYFSVVETWYKKIYEQARGFVCVPGDAASAGAPIIGVQIENEFGHCGGLSDETGDEHMKRLQSMAKKIGFDVAIYTATGWGGARTGGMLPVMGGYCDAPWDQRTTEIEPSGNYVFTHERNDHNIGSDHGLGYGITFDSTKFPYLTAELGGGLQVTAHRRTVATARDIAAVATVKLGSGVNLLGYYMYCGGTNPEGKLTTLQESRETGYPNDLPVKSYDFRAPVREFGQVSDTFRELKLLSYFTRDFGTALCSLPAQIPAENPADPADTTHLRWSLRTDGSRGYLFVNNYVRHQTLAEHKNVSLPLPGGETFPTLSVKSGDFFFFPFNMEFGGAKVRTAQATPLCTLGEKTVFYAQDGAGARLFDFADEKSAEAARRGFIVLSRADALNAWRVDGGTRLILAGAESYALTDEGGRTVLTGRGSPAFAAYPALEKAPAGWAQGGAENRNADPSLSAAEFTTYTRAAPTTGCTVAAEKSGAAYKVDLSALAAKIGTDGVSDCFVKIRYAGERARLYAAVGGKRTLLLDHFFMGEGYPWEIGLKRFAAAGTDLSALELEITPLKKDAPIYLESRPDFGGAAEIAVLRGIDAEFEWSYVL